MAHANSATLSTDLNVDPYYDDFDPHKNYHRILYKPGLAVQARELTQSQTILQNQIDRFAEHVFEEGSIVKGLSLNLDNNIQYVKIQDDYINGNPIDVRDWVGKTIIGSNNSIQAIVLDSLTGGEENYPDTKTLYIKYIDSGTSGTDKTFISGEQLRDVSGTLSSNASILVANTDVLISDITNHALRVSFGDGILFAKDHFINVEEQSIIAGRYTANVTVRVGYDVKESIVNYAVDRSLTDPAQGSYNYAAPGADRLKLDPQIVVKDYDATLEKDFVEIVRIKNGVAEKRNNKTIYSDINDYLAKRTYEESGNYLVDGYELRVREHLLSANNGGFYTAEKGGDNEKLVVETSPGIAYVKGYRIENIATDRLTIDKAIETETSENTIFTPNYGAYVEVNEFCGNWDISNFGYVKFNTTAMFSVSETRVSDTPSTIGLSESPGQEIGTAKLKSIEYVSGSGAAAIYRMYLHDIRMTSGSFSQVKSIYADFDNGREKADVVLKNSGSQTNIAVLEEGNKTSSVFSFGLNALKSISNANYTMMWESGDQSMSTAGTVSITPPPGFKFAFTGDPLSAATIKEKIILSVNETGTVRSNTIAGALATKSGGSATCTISGVTATSVFNAGETLLIDAKEYTIESVNNATTLTLSGDLSSSFTGVTVIKQFPRGSVFDLTGYGEGGARVVTATENTLTIDVEEILTGTLNVKILTEITSKTNTYPLQKNRKNNYLVQLNLNTAGTTGPWSLGIPDVFKINSIRKKSGSPFINLVEGTDITSNFSFDTGIDDNLYKHSKILINRLNPPTLTASDYLLVDFDWFETVGASDTQLYYTLDSYPIDDINGSANTSAITTAEIPFFVSPLTNQSYDMRDCVDFRKQVQRTAAAVSTLSGISTNPVETLDIDITNYDTTNGFLYPSQNENFTADVEYYLPRIDRVVISSTGKISSVTGVSRLNPYTPAPPSDGLTIGYLKIPPYPSLPYERVKVYFRPNLYVGVSTVRQVRFTMKEIGALKERIKNLEYYTSLSLLETDTKNMTILDANDINRFKNGILVDPFTSHNIGDIRNDDYRIAVDPKKRELIPSFKFDDVQLEYIQGSSTTVKGSGRRSKAGKLITLPYTHDLLIDQNQVSGTRSVTGLAYNWAGDLYIDPDNDYWVDTTRNPAVTVNMDFGTDAIQEIANFIGTQWESWETVGTTTTTAAETRTVQQTSFNFNGPTALPGGVGFGGFGFFGGLGLGGLTATTQAVQVRTGATIVTTTTEQERTGQFLDVNAQEQTYNLGDSVRDVSVIPFMRSRIVQVVAYGLKPGTVVYPFFDGEPVDDYCRPADENLAATGSYGAALTTNSEGNIWILFRIPNDNNMRFTTGTKKFRLTDNINNDAYSGAFTTWAEGSYTASGLQQTVSETVISTTTPVVEIQDVTQTREIVNTVRIPPPPPPAPPPRRRDPSGQTFTIDLHSDGDGSHLSTGAFVTKLDLFFATKSTTEGITVELRECDPNSGYISSKVIPNSTIDLRPSQVRISTDGITNPTTITFPSPIFLLADTDYAWIVRPVAGNPDYSMWMGRTGANDINTGSRIVANPYSGVFFQSSNDRVWSPIQEEDAAFRLYIADFGTNQSATAIFHNIEKEYLEFEPSTVTGAFNNVGEEIHGETRMHITKYGSSEPFVVPELNIQVGDIIEDANTAATGEITYSANGYGGILGTYIVVKDITIDKKFGNGNQIKLFKSGVEQSNTFSIYNQWTPTGEVYHWDSSHLPDNAYLHITNRNNVNFGTGEWVRGQTLNESAKISDIPPISIDALSSKVGSIVLQDTALKMEISLNTLADSESAGSYFVVSPNETKLLQQRAYVLSQSGEPTTWIDADDSYIGGSAWDTAKVRLTLSNAGNKRVSPVLDSDRISLFTIENLVNNDSTAEDSAEGGNARARYISKKATLSINQDAEDFKVFLTAYKPATSSIKVYAKLQNGEDSDNFNTEKDWLELTQVSSESNATSSSDDRYDFKELEFTIPDSALTGSSGEYQYQNSEGITFTGFKYYSVKIVLLSTNTANPPRVKDMRAICLQI